MISHKHKCIFVHVPKAAGTSIEGAFMEELRIDRPNRHALLLGTNTNLDVGPRIISHLSASEYVSNHFISQDLFDSYFKFAIVRNPYTRLFAIYHYYYYHKYITFDYFVLSKLDKLLESKEQRYFLKPQYEYLCDANGDLLVDFVGKIEQIETDFEKIKKLGDWPDFKLLHLNKTADFIDLNFFSLVNKLIREDLKTILHINFRKSGKLTLSDRAQEKLISIYKKDFLLFDYPTNL